MSATTAARGRMAELIELKASTAEMLIETRYAANIQNAQIGAISAEAVFRTFNNDRAINAADTTTSVTKPCK